MRQGVLGIPNLQGAYNASTAGGPHILMTTAIGGFHVDGAALATGTAGNDDGPVYSSFTRGAVNVLNVAYNAVDFRAHIYSTAINGVDIGPDPAILPNRSTIRIGPDQLQFLRQDRQILTGSPGFFLWNSTLTMDASVAFLARSFGGFIDLGGVFQFDASTSPFGMGNALLHRATWKNANGVVANLGPSFLFANNAIIQADGATITSSQARIFFDNTNYNVINAGVGTGLAVGHNSFYANLTVDTGWTLPLRRGLFVQDASGGGTLTEQVVVDVEDLIFATTNIGIRSVMTAGAGKFFIEATGSAPVLLGGDVEIDGAFNHDGSTFGQFGATPVVQDTGWLLTNFTVLRAYDAATATLSDVARTVATLVENALKPQGVIGA